MFENAVTVWSPMDTDRFLVVPFLTSSEVTSWKIDDHVLVWHSWTGLEERDGHKTLSNNRTEGPHRSYAVTFYRSTYYALHERSALGRCLPSRVVHVSSKGVRRFSEAGTKGKSHRNILSIVVMLLTCHVRVPFCPEVTVTFNIYILAELGDKLRIQTNASLYDSLCGYLPVVSRVHLSRPESVVDGRRRRVAGFLSCGNTQGRVLNKSASLLFRVPRKIFSVANQPTRNDVIITRPWVDPYKTLQMAGGLKQLAGRSVLLMTKQFRSLGHALPSTPTSKGKLRLLCLLIILSCHKLN